jgi:hypothetical protein
LPRADTAFYVYGALTNAREIWWLSTIIPRNRVRIRRLSMQPNAESHLQVGCPLGWYLAVRCPMDDRGRKNRKKEPEFHQEESIKLVSRWIDHS